jgi:hypothetical protein
VKIAGSEGGKAARDLVTRSAILKFESYQAALSSL